MMLQRVAQTYPVPRGADRIIRRLRLEPQLDAPVVVSLIGSLDWPNPTVYAEAGRRYDWDFVQGQVLFLASDSDHHPGRLLVDLIEADPFSVSLVDVKSRRGAEVFKVHGAIRVLPWLPFRNEEFLWN